MCDFTTDTAQLILTYLDGWILDNTEDVHRLEYNKKVNIEEIKQYFDTAITYSRAYMGFNETDTIEEHLLPFVYMWTAGLLYKKYDIRPNDLIDETYPVGYGDQLIITAKSGLTPYKKYEFNVF